MATIIWKEANPYGTAKSRYKARRAAMVAGRRRDEAMEKSVTQAMTGCSDRVNKAVSAPTIRSKPQPSADNLCLGDVAIYNAGFRKKNDSVTAR